MSATQLAVAAYGTGWVIWLWREKIVAELAFLYRALKPARRQRKMLCECNDAWHRSEFRHARPAPHSIVPADIGRQTGQSAAARALEQIRKRAQANELAWRDAQERMHEIEKRAIPRPDSEYRTVNLRNEGRLVTQFRNGESDVWHTMLPGQVTDTSPFTPDAQQRAGRKPHE